VSTRRHDIAMQHITALARTEGYIEIRALKRIPASDPSKSDDLQFRGSAFIHVNGTINGAEDALKRADEWDRAGIEVFIAPNLRARQGRKKADVETLTQCYADLDLKGEHLDEAFEDLLAAPKPPGKINGSGYGLHPYWPIEPSADKDLWKRVQHGIRASFDKWNADPQIATDEARVLRLTPYPNRKYGHEVETEILYSSDVVYTLEELAAVYAPEVQPQLTPAKDTPKRQEKKRGELPKRTRDYLAHGASSGSRNNELYAAAQQFHAAGYPQIDAETTLLPRAQQDGLSRDEAQRTISSAYQSTEVTKPIEEAERKPDLLDLGRDFAKRYSARVAYTEDTAAWSIYTGTHWRELSRGTTVLRDMATTVIRDSGLPVSSINKVEGVIQMAASHCKRILAPRPGLVNFRNGTLDLDTMTLRAHDPGDGLDTCLPYDYRPGAHPAIDSVLMQTVPDPIAREAFAAFVGTGIMRDYGLQYALLLLGPLRSGKSTLRQLANLVSGNDRFACAGPELFGRELEGMRSRAAHNNHLIVTLEELPVEALRNEEQFKAMTAHGGVAQRRLHQPEITNNQWRPKLLMVTNEAPRYSDRSGALTDRLIIVNCPNSRAEGERDLYLIDKLLPEVGAFAVTCIQKAKEALAAGHYPQSIAMRAARDEIERNGDGLKSFVAEECVIEPSAWIETANLYKAYKVYCDENGHGLMSKARFTQALGERFRTVEPKSKRVPKPVGTALTSYVARGIQGIRLRTPGDPDPDELVTPVTPALHPNGETRNSGLEQQEALNPHTVTPVTPHSAFLQRTTEESVSADAPEARAEREKDFADSGVTGVYSAADTASQSPETALHLNAETRNSAVTKVKQVLQVWPALPNSTFVAPRPLTDAEAERTVETLMAVESWPAARKAVEKHIRDTARRADLLATIDAAEARQKAVPHG
jgi:putative DNA primase/helicase